MKEGDIDDPDTRMKINTDMAVIYFSNNNLTEGFEHSQILLQILNDYYRFDPVAKSDVHIVVARDYYLAGNFDIAIEHCQKSLLIHTVIFSDNHPILPLTYKELADMYDENEQHNLAIEYYTKSMELYEKYSSKIDLLEIKTMLRSNTGRCYLVIQQFDLSRLNFEKVLKIQERIIPYDEIKLANLHENIAICYWSTKTYDLTIQHYKEALELRKKISFNSIEIITLYKQIGVCYDAKKRT
jgi:tetratricopeptide (TPR) repeat protein